MSIDDLIFLAKGLVKDWNKEKLKDKLKTTALDALVNRVKVAELEDKVSGLEDEIRRLKGEKTKSEITPANTDDLNLPQKKKHKKKSKKLILKLIKRLSLISRTKIFLLMPNSLVKERSLSRT
jgi:uncharacterized small protein (DUF1192 family)